MAATSHHQQALLAERNTPCWLQHTLLTGANSIPYWLAPTGPAGQTQHALLAATLCQPCRACMDAAFAKGHSSKMLRQALDSTQ
eukprot:1161200-Pelagomonas_calceolata.AAC.12